MCGTNCCVYAARHITSVFLREQDMANVQSPRERPSYNVRIPPPKTRFGWLGGFLYRVKKNKELNVARLYGLGGIAGLLVAFVGLKKMVDYDMKYNRRHKSVEELLDVASPKDSDAGESDNNMPSFKPDYVVKAAGEGTPEIRISEKDDCVEAAFILPFVGLKSTTKVPMKACQFDDQGNIVLDDRGFPLFVGQNENRWRDRFDNLKSKVKSLPLFK